MWARDGSSQYPPFTAATTPSLSQQHSTTEPTNCGPQIPTATMIGKSAMETPEKTDRSLHCTWNQLHLHHMPHPHPPEASDEVSINGDQRATSLINDIPFQELANTCYHSKSALKVTFSLIMWSCLWNCDSRTNIPRRNRSPGLITLKAWFRWPANACSSHFVHSFHSATNSLSFSNFPCGSLSCSSSESSSTPKRMILVAGPSVFSTATGKHVSSHVSHAVLWFWPHSCDIEHQQWQSHPGNDWGPVLLFVWSYRLMLLLRHWISLEQSKDQKLMAMLCQQIIAHFTPFLTFSDLGEMGPACTPIWDQT